MLLQQAKKYREIARVMGVPNVDTMDEATYRQAAIDVIQKLADDVGIPKSLSEAGVKREDIPFLAESAFNAHVRQVIHEM